MEPNLLEQNGTTEINNRDKPSDKRLCVFKRDAHVAPTELE